MPQRYIDKLLIQPSVHVIESIINDFQIKAIFTALVSFVTFAIYENETAIGVLIGFVLIDWLTGVIAAWKTKTFTSSKFRETVIKLLVYLIIIALFHSLEQINKLFSYIYLDTAAATYLATTELVSILENLARISSIKLPDWILKKLRGFQETGTIETTQTQSESVVDGVPTTTTPKNEDITGA